MAIWKEFALVVFRGKVHRVSRHDAPATEAVTAYNERCNRFRQILGRLRDMTIAHEDHFWLCKRTRSCLSMAYRLQFADALVLIEFRRASDQNEEDNCQHVDRQHVRLHAKKRNIPIIAWDAVHEGTPHQQCCGYDGAGFGVLSSTLELAEGALVVLTHHLAAQVGLINGSHGVVVYVVYHPGRCPHSTTQCDCFPCTVVIDSASYTGPSFCKDDSSRRTCVPILPVTSCYEQDANITRTLFPLCLSYALTPWTTQGTTLDKVIIKLTAACGKAGRF